MRYTRISCMPFRATMDFDRVVNADDDDDARRQACLCIDRELDDILGYVNTQNVTGVRIETHEIRELRSMEGQQVWNPDPFPSEKAIPRYIELV